MDLINFDGLDALHKAGVVMRALSVSFKIEARLLDSAG